MNTYFNEFTSKPEKLQGNGAYEKMPAGALCGSGGEPAGLLGGTPGRPLGGGPDSGGHHAGHLRRFRSGHRMDDEEGGKEKWVSSFLPAAFSSPP